MIRRPFMGALALPLLLIGCFEPSENCATSSELALVKSISSENRLLFEELVSKVSTPGLLAAQKDLISVQAEVRKENAGCNDLLFLGVDPSVCVSIVRKEFAARVSAAESAVRKQQEAVRDAVRQRMDYSIEEIVLRSRNKDTQAPSCRAVLRARFNPSALEQQTAAQNTEAVARVEPESQKSAAVSAEVQVKGEINYSMERTTQKDLLGTVELIQVMDSDTSTPADTADSK